MVMAKFIQDRLRGENALEQLRQKENAVYQRQVM